MATNLDSVRIELLGEGRALTIPCKWILAVDKVLRFAADTCGLELASFEDGWAGDCGGLIGSGETPWGAVIALAEQIESR
jgi:hypothetical protein